MRRSTDIEFSNRVQVGLIFEIDKLILFLKMHLGCGLAPSSQTVGSLLIFPGWWSQPGKWSEHGSNGIYKCENWTNSENTNFHLQCWFLPTVSFKIASKFKIWLLFLMCKWVLSNEKFCAIGIFFWLSSDWQKSSSILIY